MQLPPIGTVVFEQSSPEIVNWSAFGPVSATWPTSSGKVAPGPFASVTVRDVLWVPTSLPPKEIEDGLTLWSGSVPNPVSGTRFGLSGSLEGMERLACLPPSEVGANSTATTQLAPGGTVWPEHASVSTANWPASAPTIVEAPG